MRCRVYFLYIVRKVLLFFFEKSGCCELVSPARERNFTAQVYVVRDESDGGVEDGMLDHGSVFHSAGLSESQKVPMASEWRRSEESLRTKFGRLAHGWDQAATGSWDSQVDALTETRGD